ncbi:hypothetical protein Tco_0695173 [Tanacetum coccineum]
MGYKRIQKDVHDDGFHSVKRKTSKCDNWESQDNGSCMDDLVDDTRKKVEATLRKTGIWSGRKVERNLALFSETEVHYFDMDDFAYMDKVVEKGEHKNVSSKHG